MPKRTRRNSFVLFAQIGLLMAVLTLSHWAQGRNPLILIPGLTGSELFDKETGERIWFRALKPKSGDLRLPISTDLSKNRDSLVPGDVLRTVKIGIFPITDVYGGFIKSMAERAGYYEEKWDSPSENGHQDSLYVYPYDWRLNSVENARNLIRKIEELKLKLKKPNLKFDVVAHSLGGIISRYAAMYGDAELSSRKGKFTPTWAGAKHFGKIVLIGTPNEGSLNSFSSLLNGYTFGGLSFDLPFLHDTSKYTVFTIPSAYELLPAPGTLRVFDDRLEPLEIDLYDPKDWSKYGWNPINDRDFVGEFNAAERKGAADFFAAMLNRSKLLHEALAAAKGPTGGVSIYVIGSDCKNALDAIVIYRDEKANKWKTLFRPVGFERADGFKITEDELKKVMFAPGDGVVTRRSLEAETQSAKAGVESILGRKNHTYVCGDHSKLAASSRVQDRIIRLLDKDDKADKVDQEN